jgi:outer membrane lipoprotein SlyB
MSVANKLHPLVATAAVAVIVLAGVGIAAFTGVLPGSKGASEPSAATMPAQAPAPAPAAKAPEAKPAHKPVRHAAAPKRAESAARPVEVATAKPACTDCGVVEGVREVEVKGKGTGLGAVAGGVAGALVGHELGGGNAKTLMGVVGAVGGAVAGNEVEKRARATKQWEVTVRLEDGGTRAVTLAQQPPLHVGERVRLAGNVIEPAPR